MPDRAASSPPAVHAAAMRLLESTPPGRLLDVPCGTGVLALALTARGFRVRGLDLDPSAAVRAGVDAAAADMERALPVESEAHDVATCVEGIEHVEHQAELLRELARALVPGGVLVLSTPNVLGYPSRASLARRGYARFFRPLPAGSRTPFEHEHRHPIDVVRLEHLLREAGLEVEAYDGDAGPEGSQRLARRLRRRLAARSMRRHNPRADLLLEPAVFHSRVVAVRARKVP